MSPERIKTSTSVNYDHYKALSSVQFSDKNNFWDLELIDNNGGPGPLGEGPHNTLEAYSIVINNFPLQTDWQSFFIVSKY